MARSRSKTAEATDTPETDDIFDRQIAARAEAMQNRPEDLQVKTGEIIHSVADAYQMPAEKPMTAHIANPSSTRREPNTAGYASSIKKKEYKPLPDPFGNAIVSLSTDPDGPKARILRSNDNHAMLLQFSENPGKEITDQIKDAGFHWETRAHSDFAKGAWIIALEEGREWRNHAHAEEVFKDVVNQIREKNGMEPFVSGAGQSAA
jgi:hypothetical protein